MVDMRDLNGSGLKLTNHTWGLQTKTPCMRVVAHLSLSAYRGTL